MSSAMSSDIAGTRLSRLLIAGVCLPFLFSGVGKLLNFDAAAGEFAGLGFPVPALFVWAIVAVQLGGLIAAMLLRGLPAILGAVALVAFTMAATVIAHAFGKFDGDLRFQQTNIFIEHLSITFALLLAWQAWRARNLAISINLH